jgi:hypothetical protein
MHRGTLVAFVVGVLIALAVMPACNPLNTRGSCVYDDGSGEHCDANSNRTICGQLGGLYEWEDAQAGQKRCERLGFSKVGSFYAKPSKPR